MSTSQKKSRTFWLLFQARAPISKPRPRENSSFSCISVKFLKRVSLRGKKKSFNYNLIWCKSGTENVIVYLVVWSNIAFTCSIWSRPKWTTVRWTLPSCWMHTCLDRQEHTFKQLSITKAMVHKRTRPDFTWNFWWTAWTPLSSWKEERWRWWGRCSRPRSRS